MKNSSNTPDIRLVLLTSRAEPVHSDSHYAPFESIDEGDLEALVTETLSDWPGISDSGAELGRLTYDRLPECGLSIVHDGRLLAEPGCCSTLSGAAALRDFMLRPEAGAHTLFTGHDVMQFVSVQPDPENEGLIEISTSSSRGGDESFSLSTEQAKALANKLTGELDAARRRILRTLPAVIAPNDRNVVADYLLGVNGERFW